MRREDEQVRSLLIVDDDLGFAESLGDILETRGYAPLAVDTPERAVAVLRHRRDGSAAPVALIDVRLGGLDSGVDLIPRLRLERPELICVLMTAGIDSATAIEAMRRGAYDYFDKACDPNALFAVLDRCFDRVALLREREAAYDALRAAKEEAEEAEAASRGKSGFLATMSHELRTPLNAIIGFSEMMLREVLGNLGNDQYRAYAADIHESGTHLLQIINDILDLSKAEAGKLELHEDVFGLHDTFRSVRQLIAARIHGGGLSDSFELDAALPLLRADERKTKQVLLNLVTNAVKFTPPGGQVEVAGRFDPKTGVVLTVRDTGIGIAPGDLDRVLQPFEQVDSTISRTHQGTGLGLPLVKAIMDLHGGSIVLQSEVGAGTCVTVTFPASRAVLGTCDAGADNKRNAA
jgi:signal transduction histidine kinase